MEANVGVDDLQSRNTFRVSSEDQRKRRSVKDVVG
jgi:hypothetical protein